jgi:hypothetical protein
MGDCKFCGKAAGFLRKQHRECKERFVFAIEAVRDAAQTTAIGIADRSLLANTLAKAEKDFVPQADARLAIVCGWEAAVEKFLEDGLLDSEEERKLATFQKEWALDQSELDKRGALTKLVKAAVLRDVMEGKVPQRVSIENGSLPFNFQKQEQLVWVFQDVEYLEDKTRRQYVGRSAGISVRIAKGVYYRTGAFKGHPIERTERVSLGRGLLAVTTKHVYFEGVKSFRLKHEKIVSYTPFSNGVGIVKDAASAKPQIFVTGDGWFTYNLLSNVAQL